MGKLKNKLYGFMYGRYGSDKLGNCLTVAYLVVLVLYTVLSLFVKSVWFDAVMLLLSFTLIIVIFSRMLSRNVQKRRRENECFCGFFRLRKNKFKDRKTHVYRKCPSCKAVLRLPKAKGKHSVVCPRCKNRFSVRG